MGFSKEFVLERISEEEIFEKFFGPYKLRKLYKSPLREDKNPSFNIYKGPDGRTLFKDYGADFGGDCFQFIMDLENMSFPESIEHVAYHFGLSKETPKKRFVRRRVRKGGEIIFHKKFKFMFKEFPDFGEQIDFWHRIGVNAEALKDYDTRNTEWYSYVNKEGKEIVVESKPFKPIFCYCIGEEAMKFYAPGREFTKFRTNARSIDVFGLDLLRKDYERGGKIKCAGMVAGQKDAIAVYCNTGIRCISSSSESTYIPEHIMEEILEMVDEFFVMYDNDKAGKMYSSNIAEEHSIHNVDIGKITSLNDAAEYFEHIIDTGAEEKLTELIYGTCKIKSVNN